MNMDRMTEDEIMIAELERIIRAEEAKPDGERDTQLIDECIKEMAEIKGVRAEYSQEEVAEITEKLIRDTEKEKAKRKKLVRRVAGIAAAFALVVSISACACYPLLVDFISTIIKLPSGSILNIEGITYICQGKELKYSSIDELASKEFLDYYYPINLPENIHVEEIRGVDVDEGRIYTFIFNDRKLIYTIQTGSFLSDVNSLESQEVLLENGFAFRVVSKKNKMIAYCDMDNALYTCEYDNLDTLISILNGLGKVKP